MSLAELKQEYARQQAVQVRRFHRPMDALKYTLEMKPSKTEKVTLDMCVLSVVEKTLCWTINLIEKSPDNFKQRKKLIEGLCDESKAKFVFALALWKAKKPSSDHGCGTDYVPGQHYVINNVYDLHIYYGIVQGSVQARHLVKMETDEPRYDTREPATSKLKVPNVSPKRVKAIQAKVKSTPTRGKTKNGDLVGNKTTGGGIAKTTVIRVKPVLSKTKVTACRTKAANADARAGRGIGQLEETVEETSASVTDAKED